jgi:hypothetical protein
MSGETRLPLLLRSMNPRLDPGSYGFYDFESDEQAGELVGEALGLFREDESITLILPSSIALSAGLPEVPAWARITLTVHSSLMAVGLLAAVTRTLADAGIPINAVSAVHHDHLFVPWDRRHQALAVLEALSQKGER